MGNESAIPSIANWQLPSPPDSDAPAQNDAMTLMTTFCSFLLLGKNR